MFLQSNLRYTIHRVAVLLIIVPTQLPLLVVENSPYGVGAVEVYTNIGVNSSPCAHLSRRRAPLVLFRIHRINN